VRVRELELRLLAAAIAGLWAVVAGVLLVAYRPGGPVDLLVGLAALAPLAVAIAAAAWPPAARGRLAFRLIAALGVATVIILLPTLAGLVRQLVDGGLPTLLPSLEAAYPWLLGILGTSLFAGLGLARRIRGAASARAGRLGAATAIGLVLAAASAGAMAGAAIANDLALRDQPAASSRYGPTDPDLVPPRCDGELAAGTTARLELVLGGTVDGRSLGIADLSGTRAGQDFRWLAEVTTTRVVGIAGAAAVGERGWRREAGTRWLDVPAETARLQALDLVVVALASDPARRAAAEDLGLVYVEGAQARRCRVAVDGSTFRLAFPQVRWLVGAVDLGAWRGEIDLWVFADGQLGRAEGRLGGPGFDVEPGAVRADLVVTLTAIDRGLAVSVVPPSD